MFKSTELVLAHTTVARAESPARPHRTATCRQCGGQDVYRVRRHGVDRFISLVFPVKRYMCITHGCCWEGVLPAGVTGRQHPDRPLYSDCRIP